MWRRTRRAWQALAIKQKMMAFTGSVLLIILLSCLLDAWVVRFSLVDFYRILEENSKNSELVQALELETEIFQKYVKSPDEEKEALLQEAMQKTRKSVSELPFDYESLGAERYAKTWSIRNSFEVYQEKRDRVLGLNETVAGYLTELYEVYDMQEYLLDYARTLLIESVGAGNAVYHARYPWVIGGIAAAIVLIFLLFGAVLRLGRMIQHSISDPVVKLAEAARRIAANDFFIEDIRVENQDELGELVGAFNTMKYATAHYIQTQEEKRAALDELHEKEMERLEMEHRLESAKMELLMSQVNPHFLFNTLNVVGGMANLEEAEVTEKMIHALSDLLRYNLKNDLAAATLSGELKIVENYMYLQHMRFGARISYKIDCKADAEHIIVPAFTFQPLVENAIIHGLTPKVEGGWIKIRIWQKEAEVFITVADNGVGMPEEIRQRLREQLLQNSGSRERIGFSNVARRLIAMYPEGQVELFSKENKGTLIKIRIPMKGGK
ncbi:MAG: sensor histidine kinase [Eubacteriales bacterium]|nr:sensor histidine kinase [Eubacteriales bacterium]